LGVDEEEHLFVAVDGGDGQQIGVGIAVDVSEKKNTVVGDVGGYSEGFDGVDVEWE
jgi:hypothetical protein